MHLSVITCFASDGQNPACVLPAIPHGRLSSTTYWTVRPIDSNGKPFFENWVGLHAPSSIFCQHQARSSLSSDTSTPQVDLPLRSATLKSRRMSTRQTTHGHRLQLSPLSSLLSSPFILCFLFSPLRHGCLLDIASCKPASVSVDGASEVGGVLTARGGPLAGSPVAKKATSLRGAAPSMHWV